MASIDRATLDEATRGPNKTGFLSSIGGPQFITAQLFTILATILGVYLAGYVGFQRTLEYDRFVKAQEQANLLGSMHAELTDNAERLRAFVPILQGSMEGNGVFQGWPALHLFIWKASAENPAVFATPPQTLAGIQSFYENIGAMLADAPAQEEFRHLTSSNQYSRTKFIEGFEAQVKIAESTLLPALDTARTNAGALASKYIDAGR
jgi:hypothetical protein